jgi:hypothetical protein
MNGTYQLQVYVTPNDYETVVMVLAEKDGALRGAFIELLWRMLIMEDGKITGNTFRFHVPEFITMYGDISLEVSGKVEGDLISGELVTPIGTIPYSGKRVFDSTAPIG